MNPAIQYLGGQTTTITCYRRTGSYDSAQHNRLEVSESSFQLVGAHVGRDTRQTVIGPDGSRQRGQLKLQTDATHPQLITMKEADASQGGKIPDIVVWMGDRYVLSDVDDLSAHPLPMLRTRTYSMVRENPA